MSETEHHRGLLKVIEPYKNENTEETGKEWRKFEVEV